MSQINGLLLVDKVADMTSHDVVAKLRRILRQKTVGHTGTLDPLATGLMVVVVGDATKLSDYLMAEDKAYWVKARFGLKTDTLDRTGKILEQKPVELTPSQVEELVDELQGEFEWPVPAYSAAKVDGKKLCDYSRAGQAVELPTKIMNFWNVRVQKSGVDWAEISLACSKGSFVRTWVEQLGERAGSGAVVDELRRTRVGSWDVDQAVTLEDLEAAEGSLSVKPGAFVPMGQALPSLKAVVANAKEMKLVGHGQVPRDLGNRLIVEQKRAFERNQSVFVKVISDAGDLLAILAAEPGQGLKIRRVFRTFP